MNIQELNIVKLTDGRIGTVIMVLSNPREAYMIEFEDSYKTDDIPIVTPDKIECVVSKR
jgi:hypothetical protein